MNKNVIDTNLDFEISYRNNCIINNNEEVISDIKNTLIVKNPKKLTPFFNNTKGIIDLRGDLYLASSNYNIIHIDIVEILHSRNLISKFDLIDIYSKLPYDFLSVQRLWNKNIFVYCNSYNFSDDLKDKFLEKVNVFFTKCKSKNNHLLFVNDDFFVASKNHLNISELKNFYKSFYI
ncbi:MAG: hypothetical protein ACOC3Z_01455 [Nanoarchaeota archaeon]